MRCIFCTIVISIYGSEPLEGRSKVSLLREIFEKNGRETTSPSWRRPRPESVASGEANQAQIVTEPSPSVLDQEEKDAIVPTSDPIPKLASRKGRATSQAYQEFNKWRGFS